MQDIAGPVQSESVMMGPPICRDRQGIRARVVDGTLSLGCRLSAAGVQTRGWHSHVLTRMLRFLKHILLGARHDVQERAAVVSPGTKKFCSRYARRKCTVPATTAHGWRSASIVVSSGTYVLTADEEGVLFRSAPMSQCDQSILTGLIGGGRWFGRN